MDKQFRSIQQNSAGYNYDNALGGNHLYIVQALCILYSAANNSLRLLGTFLRTFQQGMFLTIGMESYYVIQISAITW